LLILSLDTTTRVGSVAVLRNDIVLAEIIGDPTITHGQRLPGDLHRALDTAGARVDHLDLLAVVAGPGSFTGLRVGIATMQGLALARGLKIVPVSSLEALARHAELAQSDDDALIAPWMDAQRGEVFASLYAPGAGAVVENPTAASPAATLTAWRASLDPSRMVRFIGDGAVRYRELIAGTLGPRAIIVEPSPALAVPVGRIAALDQDRAVLPHAVVPIYVRRSDAELARDRQTR
jgi:tRNA threonylcarbamoyladenosine biosynthesis protein TsaB